MTQVRVARCHYEDGKMVLPPVPSNFEPILVMTASYSKWGILSPYSLKDEKGRIIENVWQFSKVYKKVPKSTQRVSRWNKTVIWDWPAEQHVNEDETVNQAYVKWRKAGMNNPHPIRYPVGYNHRHECLYALREQGRLFFTHPLDYISARKLIYLPLYYNSVRKEHLFQELLEKLKTTNLLIIEIDGPHQESLEYYKEKYNVNNTFVQDDAMDATEENLKIMLNDPKHGFGHGYCLAIALLYPDGYKHLL